MLIFIIFDENNAKKQLIFSMSTVTIVKPKVQRTELVAALKLTRVPERSTRV